MKVLQFINSLAAGGAEKLLIDTVIGYHRRGINLDILLLSGGPSPFKDQLKNYPNIKLHVVGQNINIYNPKLIFQLHEYFMQYDIVHVHLFPSLYWASFARFLYRGKYKMILTEHSTNNKRRNKLLFRFIDRIIYKQYKYIIPISESATLNLKQHLGKSFNNIKTINNGINLKTIAHAVEYPKSYFNLKNDDFALIQISSFRYPKDQKTVIKALNLLPNNVHLLLVGDGPLKKENVQLSEELGLKKRVHFLDLRSDVPQLLKTADIAILSSHYEGLSLSSIEGMASGKPFIASNVAGLTDVVKDAGILFEYGDENELAELILKLKNDRNYYELVGRRGLEKSKNYDIETMIDEYLKLYKSVI